MRKFMSRAIMALSLVAVSAGVASAQGFGVKGGLVFPNFDTDVLKPKNNIGWQAGLFFGTGGNVSFLGEANIIRKSATFEENLPNDIDVNLTYLQVPLTLRLSGGAGNSARVYGLVGPALDFLIGDSVNGVDFNSDTFKNFSVSGVFAVGVEIQHFLIEGRYTRGFREVNDLKVLDSDSINVHTFTALVGFGF